MVHKRQHGLGGEEGSEPPNKRRSTLWTLLKGLNNDQALEEVARSLEPLMRRCVREEVESSIERQLRNPRNQIEHSGSRTLQLQFLSHLPRTLFTNSRVVSDDQTPIKIVLHDTCSNETITSGRLSSIKVKIVALDADFGIDEDWTKKDFDGKIIHNREGKRPLVTGELMVTLQDGVGYVGDIVFTDNSSWIRSGKFRLGAKVHSVIEDVSIKEGMSNAFKVKDHRGELYQKHYPPFLDDEVWRLEKIAKDGAYHKKLTENGISSVQIFLRWYFTKKSALRSMLPNISKKAWDTIIRHAMTCTLDQQKYVYKAPQGTSLFFNSVYDVVEVTFDGQSYHAVYNLTTFHKGLVENMKQQAYNNMNDWVPITDIPITGYPMMLPSPTTSDFIPRSGLQENYLQEQEHLEMQINSKYPSISRESSSFEVGESSNKIQAFDTSFPNSYGMDSSPGFFTGQNAWVSRGEYMGSQLSTEDIIPVDDNFKVGSSVWQGSNHDFGLFSSNSGMAISRNWSPKTKWCKVVAAMKWWILVKRKVASRKWNPFTTIFESESHN